MPRENHDVLKAISGAAAHWAPGLPHIGSIRERVRARPAVSPQIAFGLGLGAIGLGVWGTLWPRSVRDSLGLQASPGTIRLLFGLRELWSGLRLAGDPTQTGVLWARVGADIADIAILSRARRPAARGALVVVLAVTALDLVSAVRLGAVRRTAPSRETN